MLSDILFDFKQKFEITTASKEDYDELILAVEGYRYFYEKDLIDAVKQLIELRPHNDNDEVLFEVFDSVIKYFDSTLAVVDENNYENLMDYLKTRIAAF